MGISVKARSRNEGKESEYLTIPNDNFTKMDEVCKAFGCIPHVAIVVDAADIIRAYITSKEHLLELHPMKERATGWKMNNEWIDNYEKDDLIMKIEFITKTIKCWN